MRRSQTHPTDPYTLEEAKGPVRLQSGLGRRGSENIGGHRINCKCYEYSVYISKVGGQAVHSYSREEWGVVWKTGPNKSSVVHSAEECLKLLKEEMETS